MIVLALGVAGCGGSSQSSTATRGQTVAPPPAPRFTATLSAPNHRPRANAAWPIVITVRAADGRALRASVHYQFLFAGQVVAERSNYRFNGTFHDTIRWPARSLGIPLTFRAVITTPLGAQNLDYDVQVRG